MELSHNSACKIVLYVLTLLILVNIDFDAYEFISIF